MKSKDIFFLIFIAGILIFSFNGYGQVNKYQVIGIDSIINSSYDEQAPVFSPDGKALYFTRSKHPANIGGRKDKGDIWVSFKDPDGKWMTPVNIDQPVNNRQYNAVAGFSRDGNRMYLIGHYISDDKRTKTKGISYSEKRKGNWTSPIALDIPYFSNNSNDQSATVSYDGSIMLHSIESYNSRGAEDLYVNFKKTDGTWTDVRNLGSEINTYFQEKTPFLSADNRTLIFASNGHDGMGSMDLFISKRLDDSWKNWSKPVNMGQPINTQGRELYFFVIPGMDDAVFCSTQNSDGYGDIKYYQLLPEEVIPPIEEVLIASDTTVQEVVVERNSLVFRGNAYNAQNNEPVLATISIFLNNESEIATIDTDEGTGEYQLEISSNDEFLIRVGSKGFMNVEERISRSDFDQNILLKNYYLEPLVVGKVFKLNSVLFERASSNLIDSSYAELDNVFRMLEDNPDISIELSGHTDNVGNARKNVELSTERVEVVRQYLIDKGINATRIAGKGYGGTKPIASNRNEVTRRLNRRVEFKVIESQE